MERTGMMYAATGWREHNYIPRTPDVRRDFWKMMRREPFQLSKVWPARNGRGLIMFWDGINGKTGGSDNRTRSSSRIDHATPPITILAMTFGRAGCTTVTLRRANGGRADRDALDPGTCTPSFIPYRPIQSTMRRRPVKEYTTPE